MPDTLVASPSQLEAIGRIAATLINPGEAVGLGSGKAALAFVRALGLRVKNEGLKMIGVPTSLLTGQVAHEAGVPLATLDQVSQLDIAIDGADEVDPHLNLLKGGGGNLTREKVIASIAQRFVIVVGEEKIVPALGSKFPVFVEVIEFALPVVRRRIEAMGGSVLQRKNPDGSIFLTDNQNPYLHVTFGETDHTIHDAHALESTLKMIPGIVETGLFADMTDDVIIAKLDGSIERRTARH